MVIDDLEKRGMNRQGKERLKNGKRYLKTSYRVHCNPEEAVCLDHSFEVHFGSPTALNIETICYTTSNWCRQIFFSGRLILFALLTSEARPAKDDKYQSELCTSNNGLGNEVPSA